MASRASNAAASSSRATSTRASARSPAAPPRACQRTRTCRKPKAPELRLEAADLREPLARHLGAVGNAAREARARRLVPDREAHGLRGGADVALVKAALDEHAAHVRVLRRFEPGAVVAEVVEVGPVEHVRRGPTRAAFGRRSRRARSCSESSGRTRWPRSRVARSRATRRARGGRRSAAATATAASFSKGARLGDTAVMPDGARAEHLVRDRENERAVDAARVADEDRPHPLEDWPAGVAADSSSPMPPIRSMGLRVGLGGC